MNTTDLSGSERGVEKRGAGEAITEQVNHYSYHSMSKGETDWPIFK